MKKNLLSVLTPIIVSPKKQVLFFGWIFLTTLIFMSCQITSNESASPSSSDAIMVAREESVARNQINITTAGTYTFSGTITEPIMVSASKDDDIEIILDNADISSSLGAPIHIVEAKDVTIISAANSTNTITDNRTELQDVEDFPNAAIYSMSDLKIKGESNSLLKIVGNLNDGVTSKDDLKIIGAGMEITAKDDGIRGKDEAIIENSTLKIISGDDAIKSDNTDDSTKGVIIIDDAEITLTAGDDGIRAEQKVEIMSGKITINNSYEGIETKKIIIHGGEIHVVSQDDALNVAQKTGSSQSTGQFGRPGGGMGAVLEGGELIIHGGSIRLNAGGDGFDSNGDAVMTGGTLIVNGPTSNGDGPIDVNGTFTITGGTIIAVGSSGMAETPSESSSLYAIQVNFESALQAGTIITLQDKSAAEIFSYSPEKQFQSATYSSDKLRDGETYTFLVNGEKYTTLTLNSIITKYGESSRVWGRP